MKKIILAAFCSILLSAFSARAQNGWVPPVNFPAGTQLCDNSPWQLVFYDGFDGDTLSDQWLPYVTWDNMPVENDNWDGAHGDKPNIQFNPENIIVSNGICRLLVKNEPYSWHCDTCSVVHQTNATDAIIVTPFHINNHPNYYNSGWLEAKIKFPVFLGAHCAFWTYFGSSVNEIDMAESYGGSSPVTHYNVGAWGPQFPDPNPYNLPHNTGISNTYPGTYFWNLLIGNFFNPAEWHTYTCYWDTAKISFSLDGIPVNTIWKYSQTATIKLFGYYTYHYLIYPTCSPVSGTWNITYAYPYNSFSQSQIRLDADVDNYIPDPDSVFTLGEMDVDYVKAWQRHPEQDGHADLCHLDQEPVVTGPTILCNNETYLATPAIPGGYWSVSTGAGISGSGVSGNSAYADMYRSSNTWANASGTVTYNYPTGAEGCPVAHKYHLFNCFTIPHTHYFMVVHAQEGDQGQFRLFVPRNELSVDLHPTFEWNIAYVAGGDPDTQRVHTFGRFVSTPFYTEGSSQDYYLQWSVKATGPEGDSIIESGQRSQGTTAYGQQRDDSMLYYLDAVITDSAAYEQSVYNRVAQTFMSPDADTADIITMIEKVRAQELAPYIIYPDTGTDRTISYHLPSVPPLPEQAQDATRVYPNPAGDMLYIRPGAAFHPNASLAIKIYDLPGSLQKMRKKTYIAGEKLSVPLSGLSGGVYIVQLQQGDHKEHYKIIKNAK